jgi:hypothetical protein
MNKRQLWPEPLFGEAKQWHGLRKFRLRRLEKVNIQALVIAAGQNIKRLLSHKDRPKPLKPASAWVMDVPTTLADAISRCFLLSERRFSCQVPVWAWTSIQLIEIGNQRFRLFQQPAALCQIGPFFPLEIAISARW